MRVALQFPGEPESEFPEEVVNSPGFRIPCLGEVVYRKPRSEDVNGTVHAVEDVVWELSGNSVTLILVELEV